MKFWLFLFCLSVLQVGCGGATAVRLATLNADIPEDQLPEMKVHLDSSAWVGLFQEVKKTSVTCEQISKQMKIELYQSDKKKKAASFEKYCEDKSQKLIFRTSGPVLAGEYVLIVKSKVSKKLEPQPPKLFVEYVDPNYGAGIEQIPSGAKVLERNGAIQGSVNLSKGIKNAWYQVVGDGNFTTLSYLVEANSPPIQVSVYRMGDDLKPIKKLGVLEAKKQERYELGKHALYLEVEGSPYSGETKYSIFRKDPNPTPEPEAPPKGLNYPLLERYILSAESSVLVIKSNDKLKVGSELVVSGKPRDGEYRELGTCSVTSIQGIQASCQTDRINLTGVTQIRIELFEDDQ